MMIIINIILIILIMGLCITVLKETMWNTKTEISSMLNLIWLWPFVIIYFILSKIIKSFFWILDEISSILGKKK
jgi:hypothetical protein